MIVRVLHVKFYAPWVNSLKDKRMIVKSLCDKLRHQFNVSVIESDAQDIHQTIVISAAYLADNAALADSIGESLLRYMESHTDAEMVDVWYGE